MKMEVIPPWRSSLKGVNSSIEFFASSMEISFPTISFKSLHRSHPSMEVVPPWSSSLYFPLNPSMEPIDHSRSLWRRGLFDLFTYFWREKLLSCSAILSTGGSEILVKTPPLVPPDFPLFFTDVYDDLFTQRMFDL